MEHVTKGKVTILENGNVWTTFKNFSKLQKGFVNKSGYVIVNYNKKSVQKHRLIMSFFNGDSELTVDHIDGNKENNSLSNLEYVTSKENCERRQKRLGNYQHSKSKKVLYKGKIYESQLELSQKENLNVGNISSCAKNGWKLKGHEVKYV